MQKGAIPEHLTGQSFLRRTARAAGVHDRVLRRAELNQVAHGLWSTDPVDEHLGLARAVLPLLEPGWAFSHVTSARIHRLPIPRRLAEWPDLHVMGLTQDWRPRRPGWAGHRGAESREVGEVDGLPVTGLVDTWCDLAEFAVGRKALMGADDLVVIGDEILNRLLAKALTRRSPWDLPAQPHLDAGLVAPAHRLFAEVVDDRVRPRGKRAMTAAMALMRAGVRSPQESRARLVFAHARFPHPMVNLNVFDDHGGWLAECDLVWPEKKVIVEYQGECHSAERRRTKDRTRLAMLGERGWVTHEMWVEHCHPGSERELLLRQVAGSLGLRMCDLVIT